MQHLIMLIALVTALVLHEASHALAAWYCGDSVARLEGRCSLDPRRHLDPFGTFLLPLFLWLLSSPFLIGYARPVRIHPENFHNRRRGMLLVALAGPVGNLLAAGCIALFLPWIDSSGSGPGSLFVMLFLLYNLLLAGFNLLPVPPLDGSNIVRSILPGRLGMFWLLVEPFLAAGFIIWLVSGGWAGFLREVVEYLILRFAS